FLKIALCVFVFPLAQLDHSPVAVNTSVFGVEFHGFVVIFQRLVVLAEERVGIATIVVGFGIFRVEFDSLGIIFDREFMVAESGLCEPAARIYLGSLWIECLSLVEILNRLFELPQARVGFTTVIVGFA